ncbi:hypothetical protein ACOSQ3_026487 [Xanthoceras sorbifolium]
MESSKVFGGAEECQSSESGWTMYIGSPIHGDDDDDGHSDDDDGDYDDDIDHDTEANREVDSDDSMASDASSGIAHYKNNEEEDGDIDGKCTTTISGSDKKAKRQMGKQLQKRDQMMFKEKEDKKREVMFLAKRGGGSTTPAQSDSKVIRKNGWMSKRK